jgi:tripartite-type tricarboxylate transporter receptor subunit TctC
MVPGLALLTELGVDATLIPYQGGGPVIQALLAGDIDFTFAFPSVLTGQDNLRALLSVGDETVIDGVPTTSDLGLESITDLGAMHRVVLAPAGVPEDRLAVLREAFAALDEDGTYQALMNRLGENTDLMTGEDYQQMRLRQAEQYQALVESFQ